MSESSFSAALMSFIHGVLPSYEAAILLVMISREPERAWTAEALASRLGREAISFREIQAYLAVFQRAGYLRTDAGDALVLVPEGDPLRAVVEELRDAYDHRPVTLIRIVNSNRRIRSFADSFKVRPE